MKRLPLLLFVLVPVALAGCQTIKAHSPFRHKEPAYKSAQQERPLEVPPGMDQPATSEALAIPTPGTGSTTTGVATSSEAAATPPGGQMTQAPSMTAGADRFTLADTPDSAYRRVGLALERGEVGKVTSHDDAAHTYQVAVAAAVTQKSGGGFFHRMFHHGQSETVTGDVTVRVASEGSGSIIEATGGSDAVAQVMALLRQRLQ